MSPQMLRTLSCASNQCVAQHAGAICGKVASFWSFELLEDFLKRKHFYSSFLLSNKMRTHIKIPCCTFTERVGGVITGIEKMLPTGSSVTASWLYLSCSTGAGYVAQRPRCMCSTGQNRTSLCVSINSSVYGGLLVRITARWESLPFQRLIILAAL